MKAGREGGSVEWTVQRYDWGESRRAFGAGVVRRGAYNDHHEIGGDQLERVPTLRQLRPSGAAHKPSARGPRVG